MATKNQDKLNLGKAGEYAVYSELLKRNYNVSITEGNAKAIDLIIYYSNKTYKNIEVKTTRKKQVVTGFFQKYYDKTKLHPDLWIVVYVDDNLNNHYYILTHDEIGQEQIIRNKMTGWYQIEKGVDNIPISQLEKYKDNWSKIQ